MKKVKIADVCEILNGFAFKSEQYVVDGIRVIRIANVQKGYIEDSSPVFYPENTIGLDKYMLKKGDLLMSLTGNVGRVALLTEEFLPAALNQRVACLRLKTDEISKSFLYHYLNSDLFERLCVQSSNGVAQKNMSTEWLKEYKIPLYDCEEQKAIVSILDRVSAIIVLRKQELIEYDNLIKSRFVEMFGMPHERRFKTKTLPKIIASDKDALKRGPFGGSLKKDDFVSDGYLVYEQRHAIHNDFEYEKYYIDEDKYNAMQPFKVVPGDLLVSCSGVTLGRIAEVPIYAKKGIINQALLKITLNKNVMTNNYFMELFRNEEIQDYLFGFSRGSGIPNFPSMNEVKKVEFLCPPIELQQKYCDFLRQVDKLKLSVQKSLDETQRLFDSLMQEYFG